MLALQGQAGLLVKQLVEVLLLLAHRVKMRQELLTFHHETLLHSTLNDNLELLVVHFGLQLFDLIIQNLYPLFEIPSVDQVLSRL